MGPSSSPVPPSWPGSSHDAAEGQPSKDTNNVTRRNPVACRRCRRLRSKCRHESRNPPCEACKLAGRKTAAECYFPRRGEKDVDRQFRRRQVSPVIGTSSREGNPSSLPNDGMQQDQGRSQACRSPSAVRTQPPHSPGLSDIQRVLIPAPGFNFEDVLPPLNEVVEGCRTFVTSYFQLGFIPKAMFLEELADNPASINKFLLSCILSISARFTASLAQRYGDPRAATTYFVDLAMAMVPIEMYKPSLERIQAFFLLAISQWGNGDRDRSSMDMGVAVRMAGLLKLHCEESYVLDENCPAEQVVRSESARRVFWMIQSQENLHSGYNSPTTFPLDEITTLLPCSETDFAFGVFPQERAALAKTPPALAHPELVYSPTRCLFATLIQVHSLWGGVARRSGRTASRYNRAPPWDEGSDHQRTLKELREWEDSIPPRHVFSVWNLRCWRSEGLHLAYLSITMVLRLSNIVTRRIYLDNILTALQDNSHDTLPRQSESNPGAQRQSTGDERPGVSQNHDTERSAPPGFWRGTSEELFKNVWKLYEQIEAFFTMRSSDEGFPQILVFCVYMTGSLSTYLWQNPVLCPSLAASAEEVAQRCLAILNALHVAWPTSSRWRKGLQQIATPSNGPSPSSVHAFGASPRHDGHALSTFDQGRRSALVSVGDHVDASQRTLGTGEVSTGPTERSTGSPAPLRQEGMGSFLRFDVESMENPLLSRDLDTELDAFLQEDFCSDHLGNWMMPGLWSEFCTS